MKVKNTLLNDIADSLTLPNTEYSEKDKEACKKHINGFILIELSESDLRALNTKGFTQTLLWLNNRLKFGFDNDKIVKIINDGRSKPDVLKVFKSGLTTHDLDLCLMSIDIKMINSVLIEFKKEILEYATFKLEETGRVNDGLVGEILEEARESSEETLFYVNDVVVVTALYDILNIINSKVERANYTILNFLVEVERAYGVTRDLEAMGDVALTGVLGNGDTNTLIYFLRKVLEPYALSEGEIASYNITEQYQRVLNELNTLFNKSVEVINGLTIDDMGDYFDNLGSTLEAEKSFEKLFETLITGGITITPVKTIASFKQAIEGNIDAILNTSVATGIAILEKICQEYTIFRDSDEIIACVKEQVAQNKMNNNEYFSIILKVFEHSVDVTNVDSVLVVEFDNIIKQLLKEPLADLFSGRDSVFISGSRSIVRELPPKVIKGLDVLMTNNEIVFVGDCSGVDTLVQEYLKKHHYEKNVMVYYSGKQPRNLASGLFHLRYIEAKSSNGRILHMAKDFHMSTDCTRGIVIWDGKSVGSMENFKRLTKMGKSVNVITQPHNGGRKWNQV